MSTSVTSSITTETRCSRRGERSGPDAIRSRGIGLRSMLTYSGSPVADCATRQVSRVSHPAITAGQQLSPERDAGDALCAQLLNR